MGGPFHTAHQIHAAYQCRHFHRRNPLHCIVPPYVLEQVVENGTEAQRDAALASLEVDESLRGARLNRQSARLGQRQLASVRKLFEPSWAAFREFAVERSIYDAENGQRLPGRAVRNEGDPPAGDAAVDEAYDGLGATFDLYSEEYGRNSIDDRGMKLDATVHYDRNYDNAFWDGRQMVFGDGDIFNSFTTSVDVIGHELTHGVIERTGGLIYWAQAGALNESIADVFGVLVKQRELGQTASEANWLVGEELVTGTDIDGEALRSMIAPGTAYDDDLLGEDPQPGDMGDYVTTFEDNGGVHINSGIPNRAFVVAAMNIGGFAWEEAGLVWYEALTSPFARPLMQFRGFALLTISTAAQLFGPASDVRAAVTDAWREVGVLP